MVGLDIQDEMGRHEVGHIENSMKVPLNNGYGCRFEGEFSINKVRNWHKALCTILPVNLALFLQWPFVVDMRKDGLNGTVMLLYDD